MRRVRILAGLGAAFLLVELCGSGLAQTSGTANSDADQAEPSVKVEPPPGGCMPIGVTAAGEFVFPILCLGLIERHKAANQQPAASEEPKQKPVAAEEQRPASDGMTTGSTEEKIPAQQSESVPPEIGKHAPAETAPSLPKTEHSEPRESDHPGSTEEKIPAQRSESIPRELDKHAPAETAPLPKTEQSKPRQSNNAHRGHVRALACTHFRTYRASSGTYRDYAGVNRPCRP